MAGDQEETWDGAEELRQGNIRDFIGNLFTMYKNNAEIIWT